MDYGQLDYDLYEFVAPGNKLPWITLADYSEALDLKSSLAYKIPITNFDIKFHGHI